SSEGLYLSFQDGWVNSGTLQSSNGGVASLYGDGILDNTGGMLASSGGGSETIVEYGIVDGGSLSTSDSGRVVVTNGTLSNVTNDGETLLRIRGEDEYSVTTPKLSNTITNNAFIYVEQTSSYFGKAGVDGSATLTGSGTLELLGAVLSSAVDSGSNTLTNASGHIIMGSGGLGGGSSNFVLHNAGLILSNQFGELYLDLMAAGSTNTGSISSTNGSALYIQASGVLDNTGGWINAIDSGSQTYISYGEVLGGGLSADFSGQIIVTGAAINGVTVHGDVRLQSSSDEIDFGFSPQIKGDITNYGTLTVEDLGAYPYYATASGVVSLQGSGALLLSDGQLQGASGVVSSLTNAEGHTIGGTGYLGGEDLVLVNEGILAPGASPGLLSVLGGMEFTDTAELAIELAGTVSGSEYDVLDYSDGDLTLDGELSITLIDGFESTILSTDTFTIVEAGDSSTYTGSFTNILPTGRVLTADGVGSFAVALNGSTVVLSDYQAAPLAPSLIDDWAWEAFGDLDPATEDIVWGENANPDGDQFINLLEYAFGLDPTEGEMMINPTELSDMPAGLQLRLRQRKASSDPYLNYAVEISATLLAGSWSSDGVTEVPPRESINADLEWVTYQLPEMDEEEPQFVRVDVTESAP
ncbi:hypothetical protein, partial [Cerasicoccus frondis]|uniref:hypothetical protein n=1 Tax=Cerasicoccus frondis TaxID=490090 RepID=UPI002852C540